MVKKEISKRLTKSCVICGKQIKVIVYTDHSYRNGHYLGKIPQGGEYWECPGCYWKK